MADIDHFRPLHVERGASNTQHVEHHYSWLAYEWGNLYLACQNCNRLKSNKFPVRGRRAPLLLPHSMKLEGLNTHISLTHAGMIQRNTSTLAGMENVSIQLNAETLQSMCCP